MLTLKEELRRLSLPIEEQIRLKNEDMIAEVVPERYKDIEIDSFQSRMATITKVINGHSGLIIGANGVGKTAFIWAIYKHLLRSNNKMWPAQIISAPVLMDTLNKDVIIGKSKLASVVEMDWGKWLPRLFIDECDKIRDSEASFQCLIELIGYRYEHKLQTVCVANGTPETIQQVIPQFMYSRLTGEAEGHFKSMFTGPDMRRTFGGKTDGKEDKS